MTTKEQPLSFFRQSGWMMIATFASGLLMYAVHKVAGRMPKPEYGVFATLLQVLNLMGIPAIGLQSVFAHQAAAVFNDEQLRLLKDTIRSVLKGILGLWLCMTLVCVVFSNELISALKISNPAALWVTVVIGLAAMSTPVLMGLLQGRQNFLWLGWTTIFNGSGRFISVAVIVLVFNGHAAGAITGALIGYIVAIKTALWHNRSLFVGPASGFKWKPWLSRVLPLTLGLGTCMFMLSADMVIVQSLFEKDRTGLYAAAGMIGRALVFFTIPMTMVMFPKIVRSAAKAESTDVLTHALGATAVLSGGAALVCTIFPWLPLWIVYDKSYMEISWLVPWFAWCMVPLTLANVLINNLLARARYEVVPWLILVAAGYLTALTIFNESFLEVVVTLGVFNSILFAVAAVFGRTKKRQP
ncbi:MAG: hypothetical protein K9N52_09745 [Verrucomicrobia bacterium]|nr:hypothetical protein [Verrucomicrobiota bacterium]